jgi:plasmid stabilization system protein ParE
LIGFTARAAQQFQNLREHYEDRERPEAVRGLIAAMQEAERRIESNPAGGLAAPRPYPRLARPGWAWVKAGRYWVAYSTTQPPVIVAVFYETADIPRRV